MILVDFVKHKFDALLSLKNLKVRLRRNQTIKLNLSVQTEQVNLFLTNLKYFVKQPEKFRQLTINYTLQQNEVAERKNRSLVEMAKSRLKAKGLPIKYVLGTATHILNQNPISSLESITSYVIILEFSNVWVLFIFPLKSCKN